MYLRTYVRTFEDLGGWSWNSPPSSHRGLCIVVRGQQNCSGGERRTYLSGDPSATPRNSATAISKIRNRKSIRNHDPCAQPLVSIQSSFMYLAGKRENSNISNRQGAERRVLTDGDDGTILRLCRERERAVASALQCNPPLDDAGSNCILAVTACAYIQYSIVSSICKALCTP